LAFFARDAMRALTPAARSLSFVMLFASCADSPSGGQTVDDTGGVDVPSSTDTSPDVSVTFDARDDVDAGSDAAPDTDGQGGVGEPCNVPADCESDICLDITTGDGAGVCSDLCGDDSECPDGFECIVWQNAGDDFTTLCVPTDYCLDPDNDGYGTGPGCLGADCDEAFDDVNAGAEEVCDGRDNDCDRQTDEQASGTLESCDTGFQGVCGEGRTQCVDGALVCSAFSEPSAETCDGRDNDCDGVVDNNPVGVTVWYVDADGDRFGDDASGATACVRPEGRTSDGGDCDDTNRSVNPTVPEICDGIDNDCDGEVDEEGAAGTLTFWRDADGDGAGDAADTIQGCAPPEGYVANDDDCNDADGAIFPGAEDLCDSIDNNCNGVLDDAAGPDAGLWYADADGDGWGNRSDALYSCSAIAGRVDRADDCDDTRSAINPDAAELCDGVDNNCRDGVDEAAATDARTWFQDADEDGFGNVGVTRVSCSQPAGYVSAGDDCDDSSRSVNPAATEVCNGRDDDCDGATDEEGATGALTWYLDNDGDGVGNSLRTELACTRPANHVATGGDCNDANGAVFPGATEVCNGVDDNCVDGVDEASAVGATEWYLDADGDSWGLAGSVRNACVQPAGYVNRAGDCNDSASTRYPGAPEVCNAADDNCNGAVDEGVQTTFYRDFDTDGFGSPTSTQQACTAPAGYVINNLDCDDATALRAPGLPETCDGIDNNCNVTVDEGAQTTFFLDSDGDTYGNPAIVRDACNAPAGYVNRAGDCDDSTALRNPGRVEVCDNLDNNCNSTIDEGVQTTYYVDQDGDTYGSTTILACSQPAGTVTRGGDCNDTRLDISPGVPERCSTTFDDNCNGSINESAAVDATRWYFDTDGDGFGQSVPDFSPIGTVRACTRPADFCIRFFGICVDDPIPYVGNQSDCDDSSALARPGGGPEACDGYDNDCNGTRDDGLSRTVTIYRDGDGDGRGVTPAIQVCVEPIGQESDWVQVCCDSDDDDASTF
jgi:hypothetical protein